MSKTKKKENREICLLRSVSGAAIIQTIVLLYFRRHRGQIRKEKWGFHNLTAVKNDLTVVSVKIVTNHV